tara:strand:- start:158 stop:1177 length:1020 start_codon:yes stop_codon:yes gene_type:complete
MNEGIIYIARNPEYKEDIYKVGKTERTNLPLNRMIELSNHEGVIGQFSTIGYFLVNDVNEAETRCHQELKEFRYQNNREFFKLELSELIKKIRNAISDKIIKENIPKFNKTSDQISKGLDEFISTFHFELNPMFLFSKSEIKFKDFSKILIDNPNLVKYPRYATALTPYYHSIETKTKAYCFELRFDHIDFIGFPTVYAADILNVEDFKKHKHTEYDNQEGAINEIRKIELILEHDTEYLNKYELTIKKFKEIYNNDSLYSKYIHKKSNEFQKFENINNYIFYAFLTSGDKKLKMTKHTDGKKVWEEEDFDLINPSTRFWKGSLKRVLLEFEQISVDIV